MDISETHNQGLSREYEVILRTQALDEQIHTRLSEVAKTATLRGFRPGQLPLSVAKLKFGDQAKAEVIRDQLKLATERVADMCALPFASSPQVTITSAVDGKDIVAKISFDVLPEIHMPDLSGLDIENFVVDEDAKLIDQTLQTIARNHSTQKKLDSPRKTQKGDVVIIDCTSRSAGVVIEEMTTQDYMFELGRPGLLADFDTHLIGRDKGETVSFQTDLPESHPLKKHAGRVVDFECVVKEIYEKTEPVLDDEFARTIEYDTLAALRQTVIDNLNAYHATLIRCHVKIRIFNDLADQLTFDIPQSLYDAEYKRLLDDFTAKASSAPGDADSADTHADDVEANLEGQQNAQIAYLTTRQLRLHLLLQEIGKQNNLTVTESDKQQVIRQKMILHQVSRQDITKYYETESAQEYLQYEAFEEAMLTYILQTGKVTDTHINVEEFKKLEKAFQQIQHQHPLLQNDQISKTDDAHVSSSKHND